MEKKVGDVQVSDAGGFVTLVEVQRGPNNFFDQQLISDLADIFLELDDDIDCRAIVLAAEGKHFCAGANFGSRDNNAAQGRSADEVNPLYNEAVRLFSNKKQVVTAVQGAAVGGGFGLAMFSEFRIGCPESRFTSNFVKLGFTPGFGLTHTLARIVGQQKAQDLFYTGRRIGGEEALEMGILDRLVAQEDLRDEAIRFARQIAENAPIALMKVRAAMRGDLAEKVRIATAQESRDQFECQQTNDHREGVKAVAERRPGNFTGT